MDRPDLITVPSDRGDDRVVREEPLVIRVADQTVLTLRTPGHDEELALGFVLAEGIVRDPADVVEVTRTPRASGSSADTVEVRLAAGVALGAVARERLTRAHAIRPSCALCGLASAEGLTRHLRPLEGGAPQVSLASLAAMAEGMRALQPLFAATGGSHAAGVFPAAGGDPWAVREDVGRHNALDKALGRCVADGRDLTQAAALLSGRAGSELVLKALRLGVPIVASVSAPSSLAVELADEHGQTLVAFLRGRAGRVYADDDRILPAG